jgi:hypothetical protein
VARAAVIEGFPKSQVQSTVPLSKFYDFPHDGTYHRISIVVLITHI